MNYKCTFADKLLTFMELSEGKYLELKGKREAANMI